jgi:hypothetical protein
MNPPLTFAQALTQLTTFTSQTSNFTFNSDELTQALQSAWNDTYTGKITTDSSLSFAPGTWQYTLPSTLTTIREISIIRVPGVSPERISSDTYEVVDGVLTFNSLIDNFLGTTYTLYIKGFYKLATTDSLTNVRQINYVINLAAEILLNNLVLKRTFVFLRNDTQLSDIVRALQVVQGQVLRYKQAIHREFESS